MGGKGWKYYSYSTAQRGFNAYETEDWWYVPFCLLYFIRSLACLLPAFLHHTFSLVRLVEVLPNDLTRNLLREKLKSRESLLRLSSKSQFSIKETNNYVDSVFICSIHFPHCSVRRLVWCDFMVPPPTQFATNRVERLRRPRRWRWPPQKIIMVAGYGTQT